MTNVPSNLIPTRVTQLPVAPVADPDSLMMIVYQGNNYQIRVGDLLSVAGVPITTQVIAGTGMSGGGALSGNVTLSVAVGGIGGTQLDATGVTPGVYGNSTNIPVFTVDTNGRLATATTIPAAVPSVTGTANQITISAGPTIAMATDPVLPGSGGVIVPSGTTGQRGTSTDGNLRYNVSTGTFEGYANGAWGAIVAGGGVTSVGTGTGLTGGPITTTGTISLDNTAVTPGAYTAANITVDAQGRITLAANGASGGVTTFDAGTTGFTPSTATSGAVTLAGTLAVANGGTNATATPIAGAVPYGTGTAYAFTAAGTLGQILTSNGASAPTWGAAGVTSVASTFTGGIVGVSGSPITSTGTLAYTVAGTSGGIPYFSSGTTWATSAALTQYGVVYGGGAGASPVATAAGTAGYALIANSAAAPTFQQVSLSAGVTGTLPVLNGGTGAVNATDARTNLVAAKSGTNSDITELYALNGTAGGVAYQNVSNQLIMGSALTFDGTVLQVPGGISGGTF